MSWVLDGEQALRACEIRIARVDHRVDGKADDDQQEPEEAHGHIHVNAMCSLRVIVTRIEWGVNDETLYCSRTRLVGASRLYGRLKPIHSKGYHQWK